MQLCTYPWCGTEVRTPGRTTHYGCDLLDKGVGFAASAMPTRTASRPQPHREMSDPSWEKGIAGEHRPDGSFMPYLNSEREEMGVHEYAEKRHNVTQAVKRLKSDPTVFAAERGEPAP